MKPYEILFEDQHLIVLSKAPGILSQGDSSGEPSLVDLLRDYFGRHYVGLIHRLDRNTSGLMVVAKRSKSADRLSQQLQDGRLIRKYRAVIEGKLETEQTWKHSLLKNEKTNEVKVVPTGTPGSKTACLKVKPLQTIQRQDIDATLVEYELETGRSHQIRVQSAAMYHSLLGDSKYGSTRVKTLFHRPALHSCYLEFEHPISKEILKFEENKPKDWDF